MKNKPKLQGKCWHCWHILLTTLPKNTAQHSKIGCLPWWRVGVVFVRDLCYCKTPTTDWLNNKLVILPTLLHCELWWTLGLRPWVLLKTKQAFVIVLFPPALLSSVLQRLWRFIRIQWPCLKRVIVSFPFHISLLLESAVVMVALSPN